VPDSMLVIDSWWLHGNHQKGLTLETSKAHVRKGEGITGAAELVTRLQYLQV
jgi:hypothetical protein